jgi:hypothetical protein
MSYDYLSKYQRSSFVQDTTHLKVKSDFYTRSLRLEFITLIKIFYSNVCQYFTQYIVPNVTTINFFHPQNGISIEEYMLYRK